MRLKPWDCAGWLFCALIAMCAVWLGQIVWMTNQSFDKDMATPKMVRRLEIHITPDSWDNNNWKEFNR